MTLADITGSSFIVRVEEGRESEALEGADVF
jgi:hypothetical protein